MGFYETIFFPSLSIHSIKQTLDSLLFFILAFPFFFFFSPTKTNK